MTGEGRFFQHGVTAVSSVLLLWWPWVLAVAVVLFWGVGAFSRLLRLRAAVTRAFAALVPAWRRRLAWVRTQAFADDSETSLRLSAAHDQCVLMLDRAGQKPLDAARIRSLALAGNVLDTVWGAAAVEILPPASDAAKSEAGNLTWEALVHQALPLQMAFNTQVARYNHARALFPASVLTFILRFRRAEPLPIPEGWA
jgi:LemA protein